MINVFALMMAFVRRLVYFVKLVKLTDDCRYISTPTELGISGKTEC